MIHFFLLWFGIGFVVASLNQVMWQHDGESRYIVFGMSMVGWPITFIIDGCVLFALSLSKYLDFITDVPYALKSWNQKRLTKKRSKRQSIEA